MFIWYHYSALAIDYLSDVPSSSEYGALANSFWDMRGWTVQEFLAPKIILFYQADCTLYLDDPSRNHREPVPSQRVRCLESSASTLLYSTEKRTERARTSFTGDHSKRVKRNAVTVADLLDCEQYLSTSKHKEQQTPASPTASSWNHFAGYRSAADGTFLTPSMLYR
ncbi:hypothetical protein F4604DRAFT_1934193 [Suillus subluteus]|nr:hypothetical protein F4604DRAFT_1934193 [Suillus subluteus]